MQTIWTGTNLADSFFFDQALRGALIVTFGDDDYVSLGGPAQETVIDLGEGNDTLRVNDMLEESEVFLGEGTNRVFFGDFVEESTISGGGGKDIITFGVGAEVEYSKINLGGGKDILSSQGWLYNVTISGGAGGDLIGLKQADNLLALLGIGNDVFSLDSGEDVTVRGGAGEDIIKLNNVHDGLITDYSGNNVLCLSACNDIVVGTGGGRDLVSMRFTENTLVNTGAGDDTITNEWADGPNFVNMGAGNDRYLVTAGDFGSGTGTVNLGSFTGGDGADILDLRIYAGQGIVESRITWKDFDRDDGDAIVGLYGPVLVDGEDIIATVFGDNGGIHQITVIGVGDEFGNGFMDAGMLAGDIWGGKG